MVYTFFDKKTRWGITIESGFLSIKMFLVNTTLKIRQVKYL